MTTEEYHRYYLFVDNVWVNNQTQPVTQKGVQHSYWYCRLWRNETDKNNEDAGIKANQMHIYLACRMKIIMAKQFDITNKLPKVTLSLYKDKRYGCFIHNHSFDYSNSIKLNGAVRSTAGQKVAKRYALTAVNLNLPVDK